MFGIPARELLDAQVPLEELLGSRVSELSERLAVARGREAEYLLLEGMVAAAIADNVPDPLVLAATRRLGFPGARIDRLAADLGYADQAHMTRDSVRLTGMPLARLAELWSAGS